MKSLVIILTGIILSTSYSQSLDSNEIPRIVREQFKLSYKKAVEVKWTKDNWNYKATFKNGDEQMSVNLDTKGKIIETETGIEISELPVEVREASAKDYPKYKILAAVKIERGVRIKYKVGIRQGKSVIDLFYDEHGVLISKEKTDSRKGY